MFFSSFLKIWGHEPPNSPKHSRKRTRITAPSPNPKLCPTHPQTPLKSRWNSSETPQVARKLNGTPRKPCRRRPTYPQHYRHIVLQAFDAQFSRRWSFCSVKFLHVREYTLRFIPDLAKLLLDVLAGWTIVQRFFEQKHRNSWPILNSSLKGNVSSKLDLYCSVLAGKHKEIHCNV